MTGEIRIQCDTDPTVAASETLSVSIREKTYRLKLKIAELSARLVQNLDPLIADLIEVAGYVYAADSLVNRGGPAAARMGESWRRNFRFEIPVRNPDIWNQQSIVDALSTTLGFVSDDQYDFSFRPAINPVAFDGYFEYGQDRGMIPSSIMMFSGGLDSFAGALEETIGHRHQTVLVTHRSSTKLAPVQRQLIKYLRDQNDAPSILHVPVTAQITDGKTRESTHRSRSFLFASLGMATAQCFRVDHIKFFENGIVSMNLPLGNQVVGSRATRSTHPETMAGFSNFFSLLLGKRIRVDNPFFWKTKAEVINAVRQFAAQDQIEHTRSCAHVRDITRQHSHCGACSQCVDRRLSMLVCGLAHYDPPEKYRFDLLNDPFRTTQDKEMALAYVRAARRYREMDAAGFFKAFPEVTRALDALGQDREAGLKRLMDLHKRHGQAIANVIEKLMRTHISNVASSGAVEDTLLTMIGQDIFATREPMLTAQPDQKTPAAKLASHRFVIRLTDTRRGTRVEIASFGAFTGASAEMLITLANAFLEARGKGLAAEDHPCINAGALAEAWNLETEESVRKRMSSLRATISKRAKNAGKARPDNNEIVENIPWKGYRLNPTRVEVVRIQS